MDKKLQAITLRLD